MLTKVPLTHPSVYLPSHVFAKRIHSDSYQWRQERLAQILPTLTAPNEQQHSTVAPPTPATQLPPRPQPIPATPPTTAQQPAPPSGSGGNIVLTNEQFFRFLEQFKQQGQSSPPTASISISNNSSSNSTSSGDNDDDNLGMHELVFQKLLVQCGLTASEKDDVPDLWKQLNSKKLTKTDKCDLIRAALSSSLKYHGRRIPLLPTIITMIRERSFEGEKGGTAQAATKGLSPFAVPSLSEDEVELYTEHARAMNEASSTSVADVSAAKIKAKAPESFQGCISQLQTFGNLLERIFGDLCPLLLALDRVLECMENFTDTERRTYSKQTFASILWIVKEQARDFARGKMTGPSTVIPEFQLMLNNLQTRVPVVHGAVPVTLYTSPTTTANGGRGGGGSGGDGSGSLKREFDKEASKDKDTPKRRKTVHGVSMKPYESDKAEYFHPLMKKAMAPFLMADPRPTIKQLCAAAGCSQNDIFPNHKSLCLRAQLYGLCDKKCRHEHNKMDDDSIKSAINTLQPAFDSSAKLLKQLKV